MCVHVGWSHKLRDIRVKRAEQEVPEGTIMILQSHLLDGTGDTCPLLTNLLN